MYTRYFGLHETPFTITPNPRYLYMSELHREALAHLLYGITSDGCMILLTGDIGTGKTTLCRCLLEKLPEKTDVAVILNPRLTARELLKTICQEFGILSEHSVASIKTYIDTINQFLLKKHAEDRTVVLIIDEAQNLEIDVLEQLRLLTNLETTTKKLLRIILLGQPELRTMLERPELVQVNQRITSRYHLAPLQSSDVRNYIQHRLSVAGDNSATLFTEKAIRHAIKLTGGIPRLINVLCDRALLGAYAVNCDHVSLEIMKRAGEEIFPKKRLTVSRKVQALLIGAAVLVCLAIPALVFLPVRENTAPVPEPVTTEGENNSSSELPEQPALTEEPEAEVAPVGLTEKAAEAEQAALDAPAKPNIKSGGNNDEPQSTSENADNPPAVDTGTAAPDKADQEDLPPTTGQVEPNPAIARQTEVKPLNTITISAPLMVLEKAGPNPQQTVEELVGR